MFTSTWHSGSLLVVLLLSAAGTPSAWAQNARPPLSAEKIRSTLEQNITLDWSGQSLTDLCNHLKDKTGVPFVLDVLTLQQMGIGQDGGVAVQLNVKAANGSLRSALHRCLDPYGLVHCILGDSVLITTEEMGQYRQLRQRVSLNVRGEPLENALKKLARTTAVNIVVDHKVADKAKDPVTLQLDEEVPLSDAIRLLTFAGEMRAVRVGSVVLVTSAERAKNFPTDNLLPGQGNVNPNGMVVPLPGIRQIFPGGFGGIGQAVPGAPGIAPAVPAPAIPPLPEKAPPRPR